MFGDFYNFYWTLYHLREFALCYERHPESVRTVPWLRPAGCDSIPPHPAIYFFAVTSSPNSYFNLPQHRFQIGHVPLKNAFQERQKPRLSITAGAQHGPKVGPNRPIRGSGNRFCRVFGSLPSAIRISAIRPSWKKAGPFASFSFGI